MASIVKRKKKYSVVYTYTDENGNKRQKWETFETNAEAKKREALLEAKEEALRAKNDFEKESRERRMELQRYEKRVLNKERSTRS